MGKLFVTVFAFAPAPKANLYWFLHLVPLFILLDGFCPLLPAPRHWQSRASHASHAIAMDLQDRKIPTNLRLPGFRHALHSSTCKTWNKVQGKICHILTFKYIYKTDL
jgi:hypothetical protein